MFSWITRALLKLVWFLIIQGPLNLISGIWTVVQYLTGDIFFDTIFGGKPTKASPWMQDFGHHVPTAFYSFWILAAFMIIVVFLVQYLTLVFKDDATTKERFMKSAKGTMMAAGITIIIPVGFFFGIWMIEFLQGFIFHVFNIDDNNLASLLYHVGDPNFSGSLGKVSTPSSFSPPDNIEDYNMVATILGTWFMLYACAMVGLAVAGKVFELYCLFIIGPLFAATYSIDDGNRFKLWKDAVLGKMAVSVGTILVFTVFITLLPILFQLANQTTGTGANTHNRFSTGERTILYLLFILGGGTFVQTFPTFFANFFGESAGLTEGRAAAANGKAANGMLVSGAAGLMGAIGIGRASRQKQAAKQGINLAAMGAGGGLANAAANAGAANVAAGSQVLHRGGLLGLGGKGIRMASSLVGGASVIGAAVGLRGRAAAKGAWRSAGTHIKNVSGRRWGELKNNTSGHMNRHKTSLQQRGKNLRKQTVSPERFYGRIYSAEDQIKQNDKLKRAIKNKREAQRMMHNQYTGATKHDWSK